MKKSVIYLSLFVLALVTMACSSDDDASSASEVVEAGAISGGPFTFTVDGTPDMVSGITLDGNQSGSLSSWVVTDNATDPEILGLPTTLSDLEGVDFDAAGSGTCLIWYLRHDGSLDGAAVGNTVSQLTGTFDLSNSIAVLRISAGMLSGGPFAFVVDGTPDMVSGITIEGDPYGSESAWVVTDNAADPEILGLPGNITDVDFDAAGGGTCLIWYLRHEGGLGGAAVGNTVSQLTGDFALSNAIEVARIDAGTLSGGPFAFAVDGAPDMVSGITIEGNPYGSGSAWVVTDNAADPLILGLPSNITDVDFDAAGGGTCLIWYLRHDGSLGGAAAGNTVSQLTGTFDVSNAIEVARIEAGMISGGPFTFTVDGTPDMVSGIALDGNQYGSDSTWVVTDDSADPQILGLPGNLAALENVDFDGAGVGTCLIWYLRHDGGLGGAAVGNNVSDLTGVYDLSNAITVNRL